MYKSKREERQKNKNDSVRPNSSGCAAKRLKTNEGVKKRKQQGDVKRRKSTHGSSSNKLSWQLSNKQNSKGFSERQKQDELRKREGHKRDNGSFSKGKPSGSGLKWTRPGDFKHSGRRRIVTALHWRLE
jgi:hypothetical protein